MKRQMPTVIAVSAGLMLGIGASLFVSVTWAHRGGQVARPPAPVSTDVVHVDHLAQHRAAVREHDAENVDIDWARSMGQSLALTLSRLGKTSDFRVGKVDCRTTTCVAYLDWASYKASLEHYADVLHEGSRTDCSRETILPPPSDPSSRYQAEVVFRCKRSSAREQSRQIERQIAAD
jgi:hypothetical protein